MAKLVLLFVCVAVFQMVNALKCHHCTTGVECEDSKKWQDTECKGDTTTGTNVCLKQVYKDKTTQKDLVSRKCVVLLKGQDKFTCNPSDGEIVSCETCTTDHCNSAARMSFNVVAIAGILFAMLATKFMM